MKASSYFLAPPTIRLQFSSVVSFVRLKKSLVLLLSMLCLSSVFGYRFYNQPQLAVNTISPITITAPQDGLVEDQQTTDEKRQKAQAGITPILKRNDESTLQLKSKLATTLIDIENLRILTQKVPFLETNIISLQSQDYLLTCPPRQWQQILELLTSQNNKQGSQSQAEAVPFAFNKASSEIQAYRRQHTSQEFEALINQITLTRNQYLQAWQQIETIRPEFFGQPHELSLLKISEQDWQQVKQKLLEILHAILMQGLPEGLPTNYLEDTIEIHLKTAIPTQHQDFAHKLLLFILKDQHNLEVNQAATQHRAIQAVEAVQPEMVAIKQGEIIVKAGEKITQEDFVLLDNFRLSRRGINWEGLGVTNLLVVSSIALFRLLKRRVHRPMRQRDYLLLSLLSISTPMLAIANIPYTNLAAIGLLSSSFYGPTLAMTQVLLVSSLSHFAINTNNWPLIAGTIGGLLAAAMAGKLRSRDELALLGAGVGIVQGAAYLIIYLIASSAAGTIWHTRLLSSLLFGLSGVAWCIFALGISAYLERFFDLVTPIRLVELANPNRPLLQRLVTEAPGTFQHTLFVACLAEAAARKLYCNVELVRAGTLYHDIGKMHDPKGFIENQMGGFNKHDAINDPWKSAEIIKKHISEGLVMARKYGLPKVVRDFIPEHQGTMLISYFHHQAQQQSDRFIDERDFRYDGPIPQSRETGIVMLADSSEAALRSLKNATPEQAKVMINKIFAARWRENQLKDSGLRRDELAIIAEIFVQVWQQYNHQRIAYPKAVLDTKCVTR